ncbi:uncharacterized protein BCR38DRAFT_499783 [Pseudomassariella vexata]|uniref:Uncharacterized protein n=1 Tax=Pseudomassariella vexata TaxID=1141098 RepID=A0A1Y2DI26_9PEZI|nr:uncharacterized protein BCR38DRAFT_499783 [Pseudomassariella vexata]ORY58888.1 hypothetical protein BCR38DRAFT_499783 [Pseudomassariella vexata]
MALPEDSDLSITPFSSVNFTLQNPCDFTTWFYIAKAVAGPQLWPSINPLLPGPSIKPLLQEPPRPSDKGLENFTDKEFRLYLWYYERWRERHNDWKVQQMQLHNMDVWLFRSVAPQFWAYFKREESVREKMLAIRSALDHGPRGRWWYKGKQAKVPVTQQADLLPTSPEADHPPWKKSARPGQGRPRLGSCFGALDGRGRGEQGVVGMIRTVKEDGVGDETKLKVEEGVDHASGDGKVVETGAENGRAVNWVDSNKPVNSTVATDHQEHVEVSSVEEVEDDMFGNYKLVGASMNDHGAACGLAKGVTDVHNRAHTSGVDDMGAMGMGEECNDKDVENLDNHGPVMGQVSDDVTEDSRNGVPVAVPVCS